MRNESGTREDEVQEINLEHLFSYEKFMDGSNQAPSTIFAQFLRQNQIKKITLNKSMMRVEFAQRRPVRKLFKENLQRDNNSKKNEIISNKSKLTSVTEQFGQILPQLLVGLKEKYSLNSSAEEQFLKWVDTKSGNIPFWSMFHSILKQGTHLKYLVFSKKFLQILDYQLEEAALYYRRYKQTAITFSNDQILKLLTYNYLTILKEEGYLIKNKQFTEENIKQIAQKYIVQDQDTLIGKDNLKVVVEIRLVCLAPNILYTEITKVISKERQGHQKVNINEKQCYEKDHTSNLFKSLSSIIKLPNFMNPINQSKICTYKVLSNKDS